MRAVVYAATRLRCFKIALSGLLKSFISRAITSSAVKPREHSFSDKKLETLQRLTFEYFLKETNPENGLVPDSTREGAPCSITPTGFALAAYPVGVERGFITRSDAIKRALTTLRFLWNSSHGPEADATGYKGFYYHFLDMKTGRRTWNCELSTIDSTFLIAGALTAAQYFNRDAEDEHPLYGPMRVAGPSLRKQGRLDPGSRV